MNLDTAARVAGGHVWLERRVFEILGGWVGEVAEVPVKVVLDRHAAHAAWRAEQWYDRLPVLAGTSRDSLVAPAFTGAERLVQAASSTAGTAGRVAAAYRVLLPRVATTYRRHLEDSSSLSDGPARRTLEMTLSDVTGDWLEGQGLLESLLGDPGAVEEAAASVASLEAVLVARGR